jgi:hypothetical protein
VFNVESHLPFTEEDHPLLLRDPLSVLDRYFPGSRDLLRERGVVDLTPIHERYAIRHAADVLGFHPAYNFEQWLAELKQRPEERTQKRPPWP